MKRILGLLLLLFIICFKASSRELLNANKSQIKKYASTVGGILKADRITSDFSEDEPYNILIYVFEEPKVARNGIYEMIFFIRNKKCFRYFVAYKEEKFRKALVDKFNNPNSGLKQVKKELEWKSIANGYEIQISNTLKNGLKSPMFMLQFFEKNSVSLPQAGRLR